MDLLNGVNLYSMQSIQIKKKLKESLIAEEKTEIKTETQTSQTGKEIPANDVLDFMAKQSAILRVDVKKTVKINTIADTEQYARISSIMENFEEYVDKGLDVINGEFGNMNISEEAKMKMVLKSADQISL